jgi:protein TonB
MDREWQRALAGWLAAHKTYPDEARRSGTEGNVVLRFTIDRSGRVLDVMLVRSAGSSVLDSAAEAMVRNATLPPFTPGMSRDTVTITVQIHYALAN